MDKINTVDDYLAKLSKEQADELQRIRNIIKNEVPSAEESIAYKMPAFKYRDKPLIYFAAFKDHLSIFPTSGPIVELEKELGSYATGKGTLSYSLAKPFPEGLLKELIQVRLKQIS